MLRTGQCERGQEPTKPGGAFGDNEAEGLLFPVSELCERVGLEGFPYSQSEQEKESGGTTCGQPRSFGFLVGSNPG